MKQRVALDCDSTLAAITEPALEMMLGEDHEYAPEDFDHYDWAPQEFGEVRFMSSMWHVWTIRMDDIPICEPMLDETTATLGEKYEVDVVSSYPDHHWLTERKEEWLQKNGIQYRELVRVFNQSKAELDYDYFVDDNPNLADEIDDTQVLFLLDQPWNQYVEERENVHRVPTVAAVAEILCQPWWHRGNTKDRIQALIVQDRSPEEVHWE